MDPRATRRRTPSAEPASDPAWIKARRAAGRLVVDNGFRGMSMLGLLHPAARPGRHGVAVVRNVPYRDTGDRAHLLDVYRPVRPAARPTPTILYVHGGGFRILSKDSHWLMGLALARHGFTVFNISYRLAPRAPYPAAIEDACHAYDWVVRNADRFEADPRQLVLAGESAGANLVTGLMIAACFQRPEPYANLVYASGVTPRAVMPACGMLQVSDWQRFGRRRPLSAWLQDRLSEVSEAYLTPSAAGLPGALDLADPLLVLEGDEQPARPLPPVFAGVGTKDPLLDDTRRLADALERRGTTCVARYYPGEVHAFHAFVWRKNARRFWRDTYAFLGEVLAPG